jgi:hypothetical protein
MNDQSQEAVNGAKALLYLALSLSVIFVSLGAYRLLDAERGNVGAIPRAIDKQGDETRKYVGSWLTANVMPHVNKIATTVDGIPALTERLLDKHATRIENLAQGEIRHGFDSTLALADQRTADALNQIRELRGDLRPVFAGATALAETYAALPDRIGAELRPSWLAIEPEITCRMADGSGFGGCWHARGTALLGEAVKVGGVFTQHFPSYAISMDASAKSFTGIAADVHKFTSKATAPLTPWGKVKVGLGVAGGVGIAGARMGIF